MRKLKLQVQISVNGFIAKPGGELDWMTWGWSDDIKVYVTDLTNSMDTIILGRKLAEGFIPYWTDVKANPDHPENEAGKTFTDTPKFVFSKTLIKSLWDNTTVVNGDFVSEIKKLKDKAGKNIIVYGGAEFVSSLIKEDLIDEYHLFVNPVAIKEGLTIFDKIPDMKKLSLTYSKQFDCGINLLHYKVNSD
ncbi:MAG: dihydrofolate reductase [Ignavibacterium sp.]|nr:dihydrofolate reductase [Ignavibacterium sp.]